MAIGSTKIEKLQTSVPYINTRLIALQDNCYDKFNEIVNDLNEWATGTTIGNDTKSKLVSLNSIFASTIESCKKLLQSIDEFTIRQENINSSK